MPKKPVIVGSVVVVGSSNTDYVVEVGAIPRPGETVLGGALTIFAGGKGANQAVASARAGAKTRFVGAFGADANGRERRSELEKEGIDCAGCASLRAVASGIAMIAVVPASAKQKGDNAIVVAPGANQQLEHNHVARALKDLGPNDVLLCSLEIPLATVIAAAALARKRGARVILNPAPLPAKGLPDELLRSTDILTPNEHEFEALFAAKAGSDAAVTKLKALARRLGGKVPEFVVTRGADGVDWFDGNEYRAKVVTPPRVRAVDTVGAGDCFSGTLCAAIALGEDDRVAALKFAVAASAVSVTRPGAQASMPNRREISALLKKIKN